MRSDTGTFGAFDFLIRDGFKPDGLSERTGRLVFCLKTGKRKQRTRCGKLDKLLYRIKKLTTPCQIKKVVLKWSQ